MESVRPLRGLTLSREKRELLDLLLQEEGAGGPPAVGIPRRPAGGAVPLSFSQQRLWFIDQVLGPNAVYNLPFAIRLDYPVSVPVLERSLNEIVARHEALRTTFPAVDGTPVQVIAPVVRVRLPVLDLGALPTDQREAEALRLATEEARLPFDLATGPLLRTTLLRLGPADYVFLLTIHHIVSDGWSMGVIARELSALYAAFAAGQPSPLPPLDIQYPDFAVWQRGWLQGDVLERQLQYWRQQLSGVPVLELPADRPRPAMQTFRGAQHPIVLSRELTAAARALSQHEGVTPFMTVLAAFQILLHRYTGQDDIVVGAPIAGRNRRETEDLIGFFVNTLVLRTNLAGDPSFREALQRVRAVALGAYAHQDIPFEKLVEELQPERDPSRNPLCQVMFQLFNVPTATQRTEAMRSALPVERNTAKFDLYLELVEFPEEIRGSFEFNTDLFDRDTVQRLATHFVNLLERIVADPGRRLSELPVLSDAEHRQLVHHWNATSTPYPRDASIHALFEEQAAATPSAPAVLHGDERLTYADLNRRADELARHLRALGVSNEALVGIGLERSPDVIVAMLAVLKAGGAYVPLDPAYPRERLRFMLEDSGARVVVTHSSVVDRLHDYPGHAVCLDTDRHEMAADAIAHEAIRPVAAESLAYVMYTSGSTGRPKGVSIPHRGVVRLVRDTNYVTIRPDDVFLQLAPVSFDASTFEIWGALLNGATLALCPGRPPSLQQIAAAIESHGVTTLWLTSALFKQMVDHQLESLTSVKRLLAGGEVLPVAPAQALVDRLSDCRLVNGYGPTENTTFTCCYEVGAPLMPGRSIPIGRPVANTQVYILDEYQQPVPIGVAGELYVGGDGLARGYWNRPELTAEKFVAHPFAARSDARLYRTGDVVRYLPDGNIEFLGRRDHQVKVRGFRVELGEIEAALLQHAGVRDAAVILREDCPGDKRLTAYVVARTAPAPSFGDVRQFLQGLLPDYMLPSAMVVMDALPRNANDKVDTAALPAPDTPERLTAYVMPRSPVERRLAGIWSAVLRRSPVGIHDNFFELGGDSILSIQIIARAKQAGLQLTVEQMFRHPTIAELADLARPVSPPSSDDSVDEPAPLTPIQYWFFEQRHPEPHRFSQSVLLSPGSRLEPAVIEAAFAHLLAHHDALRLRFACDATGWRQVGGEVAETPFSVVDLTRGSEQEQAAIIDRTASEARRTLDVNQGPLLRVVLFDRGDGRSSKLLIVIHHLVVDGVSWRILLEDLQTLYRQIASGEAPALPAKTTSFQRWARLLADYASTTALEREASFWLAMEGQEPPPFPRDIASDVNRVASERHVWVAVDDDTTAALLRNVPAVYRTQVNDALLTAATQAIVEWARTPSILIDVEAHGRESIFEDVDVSRTVGWFTTVFPVRLELPSPSNPGEGLALVKEQLARIPNRGIGYMALRYLGRDEALRQRLRRLPQPAVAFNYLGRLDPSGVDSVESILHKDTGGVDRSPEAERAHLIEIDCGLVSGRFHVCWSFSEAIHRRATIEGLAQSFVRALRDIVAHSETPAAGRYTPADFSKARVSQRDLDTVLSSLSKAGERRQ